MTTLRTEKIRQRLNTALAPTLFEITDESHKHAGHIGAQTGRGHFALRIQSPTFTGKSRLQCHRLVYEALGDLLETDIHAVSIEICSS